MSMLYTCYRFQPTIQKYDSWIIWRRTSNFRVRLWKFLNEFTYVAKNIRKSNGDLPQNVLHQIAFFLLLLFLRLFRQSEKFKAPKPNSRSTKYVRVNELWFTKYDNFIRNFIALSNGVELVISKFLQKYVYTLCIVCIF